MRGIERFMRGIEKNMREMEKNMLTKGKILKKGVTSCNAVVTTHHIPNHLTPHTLRMV